MTTVQLPGTCTVKHGTRTHTVAAGTVVAIKTALVPLTGVAMAEMKLVAKGKVVREGEVATGTKLMLTRCAAAASLVQARIVEIVTGRSTPAPVYVPTGATHDEVVAIALKALGVAADNDACTLRLYLPHIGSLMRVDLALGDYLGAFAAPDGSEPSLFEIYLVPCTKGLRSDATVDAAAMEAATKAELEAAAMSRAQMEAELEAAVLRQANITLPTSLALPESIIEAAAEAERAESADGAEAKEVIEAKAAEAAPSAASMVPAKIRTGLMPALDEVQMVPIPLEVLAELEAYEAYDAEMRELAQLPYAQAREVMVASEEARLEERCAVLVSTLTPPTELTLGLGLTADDPASPRPSTPVRKHRPSIYLPSTQQRSRRCRSPSRGAVSLSSADCGACTFSDDEDAHDALEPVDHSPPLATATPSASFAAADGESESLGESSSLVAAACSQSRKRCKTCDCRLPLTAATSSACKCGESFCARHMHAHECGFDFRSSTRKKLDEANPKVEPSKLERL